MEYQRIIIALFLFFFTALIQAAPDNNPGIAFVHGTNDHREDADGGYWKTDFIQSVAQGLSKPDNYYIVHCDYSQYMWHQDAAECTAKQLLNFINEKKISSLTVYTHSNGGNVMRWILSNPTYNSTFLELTHKIKQIIALAPSSAGTPIADVVINGGVIEANISWLLGFQGDAIKQQQTGDMKIYNEELLLGTQNRPTLPVPFRVIVGTDVIASPFSSASYCNGYLLNTGLKISKLYLNQCADGFINCTSQLAAGELWFYDKDKLEDNLTINHNQSRHSCFGLDKVLITALASKGVEK